MGHGRGSMAGAAPAVQPIRHIPALIGPTASGKSAVALAWANRTGGTIVNCDAMQLYRELRIVTARPSVEDEAAAAHALYGVLAAEDVATAQRWREMAIAAIEAAPGPVLLCGGTGLYLRALMQGLSDVPTIPAEVRLQAEAERERLGPAGFHAAVAAFDPVLAARRPVNDRQRLVRAWEVFHGTGRPLSAWQADPPPGPPPGLAIHPFVLAPPRDWLYGRIDQRFRAMLDAGALEEVASVAHLPASAPLTKAVGVPELLAVHRGALTVEAATTAAQAASRQYAKRQTTWCRTQLGAAPRSYAQDYCTQTGDFFSFLDANRLTG